MSLSRLNKAQDYQKPHSETAAASDLRVDRESTAFKFVQEAHATGKPLDLTSMTDQELAEYIAGQA